jgi:hypothetical protein
MFEKRSLRPVDKMGKLVEDIEYLSRYASEKLSAVV